jgi:hypothetical protein
LDGVKLRQKEVLGKPSLEREIKPKSGYRLSCRAVRNEIAGDPVAIPILARILVQVAK